VIFSENTTARTPLTLGESYLVFLERQTEADENRRVCDLMIDYCGNSTKLGGHFGGWGLFVLDGKPEFAYAYSNQPQHKYRIPSSRTLTPGKHVVRFDLNYDGGGRGQGARAPCLWMTNRLAKVPDRPHHPDPLLPR
jgi:hypothetical protein